MGLNEFDLSRSISLQLLQRIFGAYCLVAIAITGGQAWIEFDHTKTHIKSAIAQSQLAVEESLANAVWHLDLELVDSLLAGIIQNPNIIGASIYEPNGLLLANLGTVASGERGIASLASEMGKPTATPVRYREDTFEHRFDLRPPKESGGNAIGRVVLYSSNGVVIQQVESTLWALVIAASLKTAVLWVIFIYFGQKLLSRPLKKMVATIRDLPLDASEEQLERVGRRDLNELQLLDAALHGMQAKLHHTLNDLRSANSKLSTVNTLLQRAVEQSPTLSTIFDRQARVVYTSPSFSELTGFARDEAERFYQATLAKALPPRSLIEQFQQGKRANWQGEIAFTTPQGEQRWLAIAVSPVRNADGSITHYLSTASDVSRLKAAEHSLQAKTQEQVATIEKLEEAHNQLLQSEKMASIGSLAAGVAHEINNPIGYVNSNLSSLKHYIDDLLDVLCLYESAQQQTPEAFSAVADAIERADLEFLREDVGSLLEESREGFDRVKEIIRSLMDFSRTDASEWQLSDLRKGLESTLNVVWNELKYKAEVVKEFEEIPDIECMPSQLNQVFMNLMINAAHAIPERGLISLRTRRSGDWVEVDVEDNGTGIPPELIDRLFDPFFTTKPVGKGTGLGLSVSYGIVKKHHGELLVNSEPGQGTCFRVRLPLRQPEDRSGEEAA